MPAKKETGVVLPKYVTATRRRGEIVAYKYQRRVPKRVRDGAIKMGAKVPPPMLNIYLSADLSEATSKATKLTALHDEVFSAAAGDEGAFQQRSFDDAETLLRNTFEAERDPSKGTPEGASWKDWQKALTGLSGERSGLSDNDKVQLLASYLASAFYEKELATQLIESAYPLALANIPPREPIPPASAGDRVLFDAAKGVLIDQLNYLTPDRAAPVGERLSGRMEQYANFAQIKETTRKSMAVKVNKFIKHLGRDPSLESLDTATIKDYRDALDADENMNRGSVNAYLTPLRTIFKWAVNEGYVKTDPTLQVQTLKDKRTVEDKQWKPFDDAEIKKVWSAVQAGWGPEGESRLSKPRKATFLMVFRVLLWTGMRPAEVFTLTPDDVFADRIEAKDTKTGPRTVAIANAIQDFPAFIASPAWRDALKNEKKGRGDIEGLQQTMSESFTSIIREAGLNNRKHVLYSTKSTLVRQLNWLEAPDNVQRSIIGHKTPGKLRHYTSPADLRKQAEYLNKIKYCPGLP